jgi:biopolymer transport protein ExbD
MTDKKNNEALPCINVTPLIDVLLVLLIIFMVASPLKLARFKTRIPEPPVPTDQPPPPWGLNLRVDLSSDQTIKINGTDAGSLGDLSQLMSVLSETIKMRTAKGYIDPNTGLIAKTVFIKAPRSVKYGDVARLIDGVKGSGANPVGLQVDELDEQ